MQGLRDLVQRAAGRFGYEIQPLWAAEGRPLASRLRPLFERCGIERVLDIGANVGQYRGFLRADVGYEGPVISVEPDPLLVAGMREKAKRLGDTAWTVRECALGAVRERRTFQRMRLGVFNSFLPPRAGGEDNTVLDRFEVQVERLDDLLPELGDMSRTFVKIDTQGYDLEVLRGGPLAFARVPLVQTELSFRPIYEGMPPWTESIAAFEAAGFAVADIVTLPSSGDGLAWEADGIMLREPG